MPSDRPVANSRDRVLKGVLAVLAAVIALVSYLVHGAIGVEGFVLGLLGTGLSLFGTWMGVLWVGKIIGDRSPGWQGAVAPVAALVIKLPAVLGAMAVALRLGPPAPAWFLAGLALVYFGLVGWAVTRH